MWRHKEPSSPFPSQRAYFRLRALLGFAIELPCWSDNSLLHLKAQFIMEGEGGGGANDLFYCCLHSTGLCVACQGYHHIFLCGVGRVGGETKPGRLKSILVPCLGKIKSAAEARKQTDKKPQTHITTTHLLGFFLPPPLHFSFHFSTDRIFRKLFWGMRSVDTEISLQKAKAGGVWAFLCEST